MRKGQSSVELLVVLSAVVLILAVMGFFLYQKYVRSDDLKIFVHGTRVVNSLATNINSINNVGDGYSQYLTLPSSLYGAQFYKVRFFRNESLIYIEGGSFLRGIELYWSAPISTLNVECLMTECLLGCNETAQDFCLTVNDTMNLRVTNSEGIVYLTYPYNVRQDDLSYYITPVRGNLTYNPNECKRGSFVYIYENTLEGTKSLVFQHNASEDSELPFTFAYEIGELEVTVEDDEGDFSLDVPITTWELERDECDGGVIEFNEGISLCMNGDWSKNSMDWFWLDGDGTEIELDKDVLCLSYP